MSRPKNYISQAAAAENLRRLFANTPDSDQLSLEELFIAAARDTAAAATNRNWLANKLTQLKYHGLARPVYRYGERKKLVGIQLTLKGKTALGRLPDTDNTGLPPMPNTLSPLSAPDIAQAVAVFRDNHPQFEVVFELKLKKHASHNN